jgi:mono/diheme cytochrome c family protein
MAGDGGVPEDGGVDLQPDVERIHRAIRREPGDPVEGQERAPWFFVATVAIALFWGGWYLGHHGGTFDTTTHIALASRDVGIVAQGAEQSEKSIANPIEAGKALFAKHCASCHQTSGKGIVGAFPPVVGSEWVTGAPEALVRILLHGLQGPVTVAGVTYNGAMPAWSDVLKPEEIAAVATYLRQWAPNDASAVSVEQVIALRDESGARAAWTAPELEAAANAAPAAAPAAGAANEPATPAPGGGR